MSHVTPNEYRQRLESLKQAMRAAKLEIVASVSDAVHYFYLGYNANAPGSIKAMVVRLEDDEPRLITRQMDAVSAWSTAYLRRENVEAFDDSAIAGGAWPFVARRIGELADGRDVGADLGASSFTAAASSALTQAEGIGALVDATAVLRAPRRRKTAQELQWMREAGQIAASALREGIERLAQGPTLESELASVILARQAEGLPGLPASPPLPIPLVISAGPRLFEGHARWTTDPIATGSHVNLELGAYRHRYCGALARTVSLGPPSPGLRKTWDSVVAAYQAALAAARTDAPCSAIHRAGMEVLDARGVTKRSRFGYAIGIDWGEGGLSLQAEDATLLAEDETIHIVIGTWEHEVPVIFSETVRVRAGGGESLTDFPRELIVV